VGVADTHPTLLPRGHLAAPRWRPQNKPCMRQVFANLLMILIASGMLSRVPIPLCLQYNFVVAELQP
jgi:hypothetical protein